MKLPIDTKSAAIICTIVVAFAGLTALGKVSGDVASHALMALLFLVLGKTASDGAVDLPALAGHIATAMRAEPPIMARAELVPLASPVPMRRVPLDATPIVIGAPEAAAAPTPSPQPPPLAPIPPPATPPPASVAPARRVHLAELPPERQR